MGKTLFETFFELAENDGDAASTPRGVEPEALKFARAAAISTPEPTTPPGGTGENDLWSTVLPPRSQTPASLAFLRPPGQQRAPRPPRENLWRSQTWATCPRGGIEEVALLEAAAV